MTGTPKPIYLKGGPFYGTYATNATLGIRSEQTIFIPLNEEFERTNANAFAFAMYEKIDVPSDFETFAFRRYMKADGGSFIVEFVGGQFAGKRPFPQPVQAWRAYDLVIIPMPSKALPFEGEGRLKVVLQYQKRLNKSTKLHMLQELRMATNEVRVCFELSGGPLGGKVYDSDFCVVADDALFANSFYQSTNRGEIGKRFLVTQPLVVEILEKQGRKGAVIARGLPDCIYEVFDRTEPAPYEVHVRARYVESSSP